MKGLSGSSLAELNEACLAIDARNGEVRACNPAASDLLGKPASAMIGTALTRAINCDADATRVLAHAVQSGRRATLPPFLLRGTFDAEVAVGGMLLPAADARDAIVHLLLWRLLDEEQRNATGILAASDTLAVLGVDQLRYDAQWGEWETTRLMGEIQASLLEIVRSADTVGQPSAASVLVTLRDVDIEGARDICRALLSHLHRVHTRPGSVTANARICVGLAQRAPDTSALQTLLAANNALLLAQYSQGKEPIRVAVDDDYSLIAGMMLNSAGVFSAPSAALAAQPGTAGAASPSTRKSPPPVAPIEKDIEGYVVDNMEGAVDQAVFLATLDIPVAIIGAAGTGKMYIARIIHEESGGAPDMLVPIDCRDLRSRSAANARIAREITQGEGKTLVFKSPHLLHQDVQLKLARQISSRTLADVSPPRYLPRMKLVALFPERLEVLVRRSELAEPLASAFAGYPITVPPIKDRKQAVLRWAHKILGQEGVQRDRDMKGFTPDAEQAMLLYNWPGNISEMRQCIHDALEKTDKDWLTPVDLGLFTGIDPEGAPYLPEPKPFLAAVQADETEEEGYVPSAVEALHVALGEAVHALLALNMIKPLGAWLEDELVLAAMDRYRGDLRRSGEFLHTKPRNISRWLPKIASREDERNGSALWQKPRRLLREWVRESPQLDTSPLELMADKLMAHVNEQGSALSAAVRASIMGVSTPTYLKRLRDIASG
jgi:DNA-binding NtrC family response regulator/GGDEF domain-containing protein